MGQSTEVYLKVLKQSEYCPCYICFLKVKLWENITIITYSEESMVLLKDIIRLYNVSLFSLREKD